MKPFLLGRKTLDSSPLRTLNTSQSHNHSSPKAGHVHTADSGNHDDPQIEVVKQGDKVTRLIITCTCGERIEVDCLYPANS